MNDAGIDPHRTARGSISGSATGASAGLTTRNTSSQVLWLWEQSGWTIREGTHLGQVSDGLVRLFRVRDRMRPEVSEPLRDITRQINKHVFGEATERTRNALAEILLEHKKRDTGRNAIRG